MCSCGAMPSFEKVLVVHRDEADGFVRENSGTFYIQHGYRKPKRAGKHLQQHQEQHQEQHHDLTLLDCVCTIWMLSNETFNVWSHLLATLAFAVVFPLHLHSSSLPLLPATVTGVDQSPESGLSVFGGSMLPLLAWVLYFVGCTFSFATSTGYHLFLFHSPEWFSFWVRLDLLGVTAAVCASSFLGMALAFQCSPVSQHPPLSFLMIQPPPLPCFV